MNILIYTFSDLISWLSKFWYSHISMDCIRSKNSQYHLCFYIVPCPLQTWLYCKSLYYNLLKSQIIVFDTFRTVLFERNDPKFSRIAPILRSLHWLKINERSEYKPFSLTYKVLTNCQPDYLHNLICVLNVGLEPAPLPLLLWLDHLYLRRYNPSFR